MDAFPSPLLSPTELDEAIIKITDALDTLRVEYGVVGGAAIALYARYYGLPHCAISKILIVVQPKGEFSAIEFSAKFSEKRFQDNFDCWMVQGVMVPKVIIRRPETYGKKEMAVGFELLDHYAFPDRRLYYNLSWTGLETVGCYGQLVGRR